MPEYAELFSRNKAKYGIQKPDDYFRSEMDSRERARSADTRRVSRRYPVSRYGHIEPIVTTVRIVLCRGKEVLRTEVNDYSLASVLYEVVSRTLIMMKGRFQLVCKDEIIQERSSVTCFGLFRAERNVVVTCVIAPPSVCTKCGEEPVPSGWDNAITGLPEYHMKCRHNCIYYLEFGHRGLRLWKHFSRVWIRARVYIRSGIEAGGKQIPQTPSLKNPASSRLLVFLHALR